MIKIIINEQQSGRISSFEMKGHANFAEHGKDLVCAGASAVSFGAVNAIIALTGITPDIEQASDGGYLKVVFPETEKDDEIQLIVKAMVVSLQTIEQDYGQHIKLIFNR
ncbi:ribosomal-processing cysteine protease Prp [Sporosarcina sp. FSL W8-0480]|uniref:ribosomal-processing cysteine protease Prp n=1 Tax=Sporosarcina sp. FSL W8-0480 TaxID=2954701 RepID=UPI0030DD1664